MRAGRNGHVANISIKWTKGLLVTMLLTRWDNPSCPAFTRMRGMIAQPHACTHTHTYACTVGTLSVLQSAGGERGLSN